MICHHYCVTKSITKPKSVYQKNVQYYKQYKKLVPVTHESSSNIFPVIIPQLNLLHLIPFILPVIIVLWIHTPSLPHCLL